MLYPVATFPGDALHAHGLEIPDILGCFKPNPRSPEMAKTEGYHQEDILNALMPWRRIELIKIPLQNVNFYEQQNRADNQKRRKSI